MKNGLRILVLFTFFIIVSVIIALNLQTNYVVQGILTLLGFFVTNSFAIFDLIEEERRNWKDIAFISYMTLISIVLWGMLILFIFSAIDWCNLYLEEVYDYTNNYRAMLHIIGIALAMILGWICGSMGITDEIEY